MDNEISIGDKFYKENENGDLYIIRIVKKKNDDLYMAKDEYNEDKFRIYLSDIKENYVKIIPDGYFTTSIVSLEQNLKDVIVTLHRTKDIESGNNNPYAICRQSIFDVFANQLTKESTLYVGCSISTETCPEDLDMKIFLACNGIDFSNEISIYKDDSFENIYNLIQRKTKYDDILKGLYNKMANILANNGSKILGYNKSLKDLLINNYFMLDFDKAFDIIKVDFNFNEQDLEVPAREKILKLEDMIKYQMIQPICVKYDYEIDLDKIEKEYILVKDKSNNLYVIAYDKGKYVNRPYIQQNPDKAELLSLSKYSSKTFQ